MTESQATAPSKSKPARKRPKSRIAGWIAIFACAQVGLNVAKQHILENFNGFANEIVTAQPQEITRKQRGNYGHRRAQNPRYGKTAETTAFGRTSKIATKVSFKAENLYRARIFSGAKKERITPSARSTTSTLQTSRFQMSRMPAVTPITNQSTVSYCKVIS